LDVDAAHGVVVDDAIVADVSGAPAVGVMIARKS